jgi:hypothetical protein
MPNIFLNALSVKGVKNITANCEIQFQPKGRVKAVYGSNGAGKTALIAGASMLKRLLLDSDYLVTEKRALTDLVNKHARQAELSAVITAGKTKYRYYVVVDCRAEVPMLACEKIEQFLHGAKKRTLFYSVKGELKEFGSLLSDDIRAKTQNLLQKSSLISLVVEGMRTSEPLFSKTARVPFVDALISFAKQMGVYLCAGDLPSSPYELTSHSVPEQMRQRLVEISNNNRYKELLFIPPSALEAYEEETKRLFSFIKMFKPDLQSIDVDHRKVDQGVISVERIFNYGKGCKINSYLESTGVRSLTNIFPFISAAMTGSIVFIDELDSGINGILLESLIRYLNAYAQGQLCFTCHDSYLMDALEESKYGISFLSPSRGITNWIKNGHYSPESQWTQGYIPGFAFNYEPLDFHEAFPRRNEA